MRTIRSFISDLLEMLHNIYDEGESKAIAQHLLLHTLGITQTDLLLLSKDTALSSESEHYLYQALQRLGQGEPLQYVLGYTYFLNCKLYTDPGVLIPRPETEELLYIIREDWRGQGIEVHVPRRIFDIGTGSACIPVGLAHLLGTQFVKQIDALEISPDAIAIAQQNAERAMVETGVQIEIKEGNLFELPEWSKEQEPYDMLVSNPPYIHPDEAELMTEQVLSWEPHTALFTPAEAPTLYYDAIANLVCKGYLRTGGDVYLEINPLYADATLSSMCAIIGSEHIEQARIIQDMSNKARFIHLRTK